MRRVTVIGSESTGKTTLAAALAGHFQVACVPEFSRGYAELVGRALGYEDVEPIARGQLALQAAAERARPQLVIRDTDLVSTVVYATHYYAACPAWVAEAAAAERAELYLLLDIDVPWVPDAQRDRPHLREHMHGLFVAGLERLGASFVRIAGDWSQRRARALEAVEALVRRR